MEYIRFFRIMLLVLLAGGLSAQSPLSTFMNGKGKGAASLSFTTESYDNVFLVPADAQGVPVFDEVTLNSVSLYGSYGISDRLDAIVSLPYISATGNASPTVLNELNFENSREGLQDVSVFLRYNPLTLDVGGSQLRFMLGGGITAPLGDYRVDEGLQSIIAIGNRATTFNGLAMAQLKTATGFFLGTQAGYSFRDGEVPNALIGEIKAGYAASKFYVDVWYAGQVSDGGVNILGEGFTGFFPATDVTFTRAGLSVYAPIGAGFGLSASAAQYLTGRNIGESTAFSGAVIYSF